eukprot:CFRG6948T1
MFLQNAKSTSVDNSDTMKVECIHNSIYEVKSEAGGSILQPEPPNVQNMSHAALPETPDLLPESTTLPPAEKSQSENQPHRQAKVRADVDVYSSLHTNETRKRTQTPTPERPHVNVTENTETCTSGGTEEKLSLKLSNTQTDVLMRVSSKELEFMEGPSDMSNSLCVNVISHVRESESAHKTGNTDMCNGLSNNASSIDIVMKESSDMASSAEILDDSARDPTQEDMRVAVSSDSTQTHALVPTSESDTTMFLDFISTMHRRASQGVVSDPAPATANSSVHAYTHSPTQRLTSKSSSLYHTPKKEYENVYFQSARIHPNSQPHADRYRNGKNGRSMSADDVVGMSHDRVTTSDSNISAVAMKNEYMYTQQRCFRDGLEQFKHAPYSYRAHTHPHPYRPPSYPHQHTHSHLKKHEYAIESKKGSDSFVSGMYDDRPCQQNTGEHTESESNFVYQMHRQPLQNMVNGAGTGTGHSRRHSGVSPSRDESTGTKNKECEWQREGGEGDLQTCASAHLDTCSSVHERDYKIEITGSRKKRNYDNAYSNEELHTYNENNIDNTSGCDSLTAKSSNTQSYDDYNNCLRTHHVTGNSLITSQRHGDCCVASSGNSSRTVSYPSSPASYTQDLPIMDATTYKPTSITKTHEYPRTVQHAHTRAKDNEEMAHGKEDTVVMREKIGSVEYFGTGDTKGNHVDISGSTNTTTQARILTPATKGLKRLKKTVSEGSLMHAASGSGGSAISGGGAGGGGGGDRLVVMSREQYQQVQDFLASLNQHHNIRRSSAHTQTASLRTDENEHSRKQSDSNTCSASTLTSTSSAPDSGVSLRGIGSIDVNEGEGLGLVTVQRFFFKYEARRRLQLHQQQQQQFMRLQSTTRPYTQTQGHNLGYAPTHSRGFEYGSQPLHSLTHQPTNAFSRMNGRHPHVSTHAHVQSHAQVFSKQGGSLLRTYSTPQLSYGQSSPFSHSSGIQTQQQSPLVSFKPSTTQPHTPPSTHTHTEIVSQASMLVGNARPGSPSLTASSTPHIEDERGYVDVYSNTHMNTSTSTSTSTISCTDSSAHTHTNDGNNDADYKNGNGNNISEDMVTGAAVGEDLVNPPLHITDQINLGEWFRFTSNRLHLYYGQLHAKASSNSNEASDEEERTLHEDIAHGVRLKAMESLIELRRMYQDQAMRITSKDQARVPKDEQSAKQHQSIRSGNSSKFVSIPSETATLNGPEDLTATPNTDIHSWALGTSVSLVLIHLARADLWAAFRSEDTEMITSPKGRHMFPQLKIQVTGLDPVQLYTIWLQFSTEDRDNECWKWNASKMKWEVREKNKKQQLTELKGTKSPNTEIYNHPWGSATGQKWMDGLVSFEKARLTNNPDNETLVLLSSFRRYIPVVYIAPVNHSPDGKMYIKGEVLFFRIQVAQFITSSSYHNPNMSCLKIETNPMAKSHEYRIKQAGYKNKAQGNLTL